MFVVAITELATPVEAAAVALAADLGTTAYEGRLLLSGGLPAIVLTTAARDRADQVAAQLGARGTAAMVVDVATVVASAAMSGLRRFRLEPDAATTDDLPGLRLPYDAGVALVRATHRVSTETTAVATRKQLSAARALASGGLLISAKVKTEVRSTAEERTQVLYLFRRDGQPPWILRELGTHFHGLGGKLDPSSAANFARTVQALRDRMPRAAYDDRLVTRRIAQTVAASVNGADGGRSSSSSSEAGVDLLAHVLAMWIGAAAALPYRR